MYLLSVAIPTKDRYEYLKECLKTLVALKSEKLEIVVQDNTCQNDEIVQFIKQLNWQHIKYYHDSSELSQTGNSDLAVSHLTGEFCTYIGDDDSLSKSAIDVAEYLKKNNIQACVNDMATYHWADVVFQGKAKPALTFDKGSCIKKELFSKVVMKDFLSWGCQDIKFLPRIYHAIIRHDVLEKIKLKTGSYFPGPSPDMANAVSSLLLIDKYIYISLPLIISGFSYKSAGGMGLRGAHSGNLSSVKQLPKNAETDWSPRIPKIWLGYTVWAESAEKAFQRMNQAQYIKQINYYAMYAKIFLKYPNYRKMVLNDLHGFSERFKLAYECVRFMTRWFGKRLVLWKRKHNGQQYVRKEKLTLKDACEIVNLYYDKIKDIKW